MRRKDRFPQYNLPNVMLVFCGFYVYGLAGHEIVVNGFNPLWVAVLIVGLVMSFFVIVLGGIWED